MIWHPVMLAVGVLDVVSLTLLVPAALTAIRIPLAWKPAAAGAGQLLLERKAEAASVGGRFLFYAVAGSTLLFVIGVANFFPAIVPGAMCGTGVLQSMGGLGERALAFRFFAVAVLYAWAVLDTLNRQRPDGPLTEMNARVFLLAVPLILLAQYETVQAVIRVEMRFPVDCCAVVYDQVSTAVRDARGVLPPAVWGAGWTIASVGLGVLGVWLWQGGQTVGTRVPLATVTVALIWFVTAVMALIHIFAAYHYEVLYHHCPWCLFLGEHRYAGFFLFIPLVWAVFEGGALFAVSRVSGAGDLADACGRRIRKAGRRIAISVIAFGLLAGLPAIVWRIRYGVWIGG